MSHTGLISEIGPGGYALKEERMYEAIPVDEKFDAVTTVVPREPPIPKPDEDDFWAPSEYGPPPPAPRTKDLKAGVGGVKPQLSQLPSAPLTWAARTFQYGAQKYERGNYLRPQVDRRADLDRLSAYIDAALRHIYAATTEIEWQRGCTELEGTQLLIGGYPDAESGLPHLAHALTSLMMAIQQAVNAGILVEDPGTPWSDK
jgi:hypothetical protein